MNKQQRIIIAILIPFIGLLGSYAAAEKLLDREATPCPTSDFMECAGWRIANPGNGWRHVSAFDFEDTWWIWVMGVLITGGVEFKLFDSKNKK
jgi:hypothetical protein